MPRETQRVCVTKNAPLAFCWDRVGRIPTRPLHSHEGFAYLRQSWRVLGLSLMRSKQTMLFCSIDQSATSWQSHTGENRYPQHPHALASDCPALNQIIRLVQHDFDYDLRFCYFFYFSLPVRLASVKSDWLRWSDRSWPDWIDLRVISTRFRIIVGLQIKVEMAQMMIDLVIELS